MGERIRYASHAYGITQAWIGFLMVLTIAQMTLKPYGLSLDFDALNENGAAEAAPDADEVTASSDN